MNLQAKPKTAHQGLPRAMDERTTEPVQAAVTAPFLRMQHGRVVIGDILYPMGGTFGPRVQADYQLVVIHSGWLLLTVDGETVSVPENFAVLLSPGHTEYFCFATDRETRHSWVAIEPGMLTRPLRQMLKRARGPAPFVGRMLTLMNIALQGLFPVPQAGFLPQSANEALGGTIVCAFASSVMNGSLPAQPGTGILLRMERYIEEAYSRHTTLQDIARAAGASRQHLLKLCRVAGKSTPTEQLYVKRLEVAAGLLLHSGFSVAQIAEQCGFANQFHFSRKFKQMFRRSPSAWRSEVWKHPR